MDTGTSRFIAITLTEAEWHALRAIKPNPSAWLKQQIDRALEEAGLTPTAEEEDERSGFKAFA